MRTIRRIITLTALLATVLIPIGTGTAGAEGVGSGNQLSRPARSFHHVATFDVIDGNGSGVAEIIDATADGNTLVYTDADNEAIGFVDISVPSNPIGTGTVSVGGEPTSLVVRGDTVLVAVNTSTSFVEPSGKLLVINIASRAVEAELPLAGQPDSMAMNANERILAVVIENERDEDLNGGFLPQEPTGGVTFFNMRRSDPNRWRTYEANLDEVALAAPNGTDLEPEYVDIQGPRAVITFQENNYIAVVSTWSGRLLRHFSAGSVELSNVDNAEDDLITLDTNLTKRREPDAAAWINRKMFATANEGDYEDPTGEQGGSRGFTIFDRRGGVVYESAESFEHLFVAAGQYNEGRSENKGVEPESVEFGNYNGDQFLFVGSERSNAVVVYDVANPWNPEFVQMLPTGIGPEGLKAIPDHNLFVVSTEADEADDGIPTMINIYEFVDDLPEYPMLYSTTDASGLPIPWVALSGMVGDPVDPSTVYAVSDSFLASGFVYTIDVSRKPAVITDRLEVTGASAELDLEGVAVGPDGSLWLGSEGNSGSRPNLVLQVDPTTGAVISEVELPAGLTDQRRGNGIEGIAVTGDAGAEVVYVTIQRAWPDEGDTDQVNTKIGRYDVTTGEWGFVHYPLEPQGNGGWIGLSELTLLPDGDFAVIERDKGWGPTTGPNAELKAVFEVDLDSAWFRPFDDPDGLVTIEKGLLADLLPEVAEASIWTAEKVEGLAVTADQRIFVVTDNDGVDDAPGETLFLELDFDLNLDFGVETTIPEIQGAGHLSPLVGEEVTTSGVVTAVLFNGYYLQDPVGDGDDATSDGIFVFTGGDPKPAVGDEIEIVGTVSEFIPGGADTGNLSVTQLSGPFSVLSQGNPLPEPVEIGIRGRIPPSETVISDAELPTNLQDVPGTYNPETDGIDFYESLEGMYVQVDRPKASSAVREFNAFSAEFFAVPSNGRVATERSHLTQRGGILLQPDPDNTGDQNPERVQIQFDANVYPGDVPAVTVGDRFADVNGVVGYSFGNYEVIATEELQYWRESYNQPEVTSLRPTRRQVTVASYNVLNLSPGPEDDAQRAKVAGHIVDNLRAPDVVALQEIQDNSGEADDGTTEADLTLQALVDAIVLAGGPQYEFFDVAPADGAFGGIPGGNIRNAFLYNPARVDLLDFASLDAEVLNLVGAPNPQAFDGSRSPLAGLFSFDGTPFTVVNVHDTSRFGSSPIFGGPQPFEQAGEQAREDQAAALNSFTDFVVGEQADAIVMVAGDMNTFEWTNDLVDILPGPDQVLTNLMTTNALRYGDQRDRYTFIFDGNSQALDHFFVTENLVSLWQTRLDIVHVNVDFPRRLNDVVGSDHEPLVARFRLPRAQGPLLLPGSDGADAEFTLQLLHASDLEGGVDALDRATNFAAIVDALEDDTEVDGSLTVSAGDNYIPGPFFGASGDRSMRAVFQSVYDGLFPGAGLSNIREGGGRGDVTIMNVIGFDASAIGNHEFDAGSDAFAGIIADDVRSGGDIRWTGADFPYLSSNLDFSADDSLADLFTGEVLENTAFAASPSELLVGVSPPKIAPSTFVTVGDGERIGIVGATTELLGSISSPGDTSVIGPLAGLVQAEIDRLTAMGIDKIIVTSHLQQLALEEQLATQLSGVDIIIAGGSDSLLANDDDVLRSGDFAERPYPVAATGADGNPVAIVSTDGEYSYVGQLVVGFDENGVLLPLDGIDPAVNGPIKTEDGEVEALWGSVAAATAPGTKGALVQEVVSGIQGVILAKDGNVVGESVVFLDGRRSEVRTEETNLGDLTADANLAVAQEADPTVVLSIKNGGGIRSAIGVIDSDGNFLPPPANAATGKLAGQISQLDIENSLRFNNGLTLLTLTRTELLAVLEHAVAETEPGATPGQFAQIGGASFQFNSALPAGSRILSITLDDGTLVYANGEFDEEAPETYRIVTLNFLAGGGDGYPFDALSAPDRVDLTDAGLSDGASSFAAPGSEQDALAEFLIMNHGIGAGTPFAIDETPPSSDTRIFDITTGPF